MTPLKSIIGLLVAVVFGLLSALHVFWALGGGWGKDAAIPVMEGRRTLHPSPLATLAVAAALLVSGVLVLARVGVLTLGPAPSLLVFPTLLLGVVFIARAVGDFRLIGLFKRVRGTKFARWDTFAFSPLCLTLGASILWIALR